MDDILTLVTGPGGALVLVLTILYTGITRKWVFGWVYEKEQAEKEEWKTTTLRLLNATERVVSVHEQETDVQES